LNERFSWYAILMLRLQVGGDAFDHLASSFQRLLELLFLDSEGFEYLVPHLD